MEAILNQMVEKVGIDRAMAEKVLAFLKDNAGEVTKWLQSEGAQGIIEKAKGALGGMLGGK